MNDRASPATGSGLRKTARDVAQRGNEVAAGATPQELLRAPEGELRRFAKVNPSGPKLPAPGLRPRLGRDW